MNGTLVSYLIWTGQAVQGYFPWQSKVCQSSVEYLIVLLRLKDFYFILLQSLKFVCIRIGVMTINILNTWLWYLLLVSSFRVTQCCCCQRLFVLWVYERFWYSFDHRKFWFIFYAKCAIVFCFLHLWKSFPGFWSDPARLLTRRPP